MGSGTHSSHSRLLIYRGCELRETSYKTLRFETLPQHTRGTAGTALSRKIIQKNNNFTTESAEFTERI